MITVFQTITTNINTLISEITRVCTYIDEFPVLYTIGLLFLILGSVTILSKMARSN